MPAFCTSGLRTFVDSPPPTLLTGHDRVVRCGGGGVVDRQLPVGHVIYHRGDMRAMYVRQWHHHQHHHQQPQQPQQVRGAETNRRADAVRNDNVNEKERNLTAAAAMQCAGSVNVKTEKYDILQ